MLNHKTFQIVNYWIKGGKHCNLILQLNINTQSNVCYLLCKTFLVWYFDHMYCKLRANLSHYKFFKLLRGKVRANDVFHVIKLTKSNNGIMQIYKHNQSIS